MYKMLGRLFVCKSMDYHKVLYFSGHRARQYIRNSFCKRKRKITSIFIPTVKSCPSIGYLSM